MVAAQVNQAETEPLCARLLRICLIVMGLYIILIIAAFGGESKLQANQFMSPRDMSNAPPAFFQRSNVKVTVVPKALVTPKNSSTVPKHRGRQNVMALR